MKATSLSKPIDSHRSGIPSHQLPPSRKMTKSSQHISYQQRLKCWSVATINDISCLHHPQQLLHVSQPSSSISTKTWNYHHQNPFFLLFCPSKPNQPPLYLSLMVSLIVTKRDKHTLTARPTLEGQPWGVEGRNKSVEKKNEILLMLIFFVGSFEIHHRHGKKEEETPPLFQGLLALFQGLLPLFPSFLQSSQPSEGLFWYFEIWMMFNV